MTRLYNQQSQTVILKLFDYCRTHNWAGHDPYDALNSKLIKHLPFLDFKIPRLALTQLMKRSPINFRSLLMVPKTQNPKAMALFLAAFLKLAKFDHTTFDNHINTMVELIKNLRSPNTKYWSWGYSFPWQTRKNLVPRAAANLVCTVFVANALLDLYEASLGSSIVAFSKSDKSKFTNLSASDKMFISPFACSILHIAASAADYILDELYWTQNNISGFSYPLRGLQAKVHNANFLGAALFCRIYKLSGEHKYLEPALKIVRYSTNRQKPDGSWNYGEHQTQRWIDNFHTGYNLNALRSICQSLNTSEFEPNIRRGFKFYHDHFFCRNGTPKYFHNKIYPIDIHSVAQSIITLMNLKDLDQDNVELAYRVLNWAVANMWDKRGYFYYQVTPFYKNKISYMRWSQAWMFLALATLLEQQTED